jgi:hypothetical protein
MKYTPLQKDFPTKNDSFASVQSPQMSPGRCARLQAVKSTTPQHPKRHSVNSTSGTALKTVALQLMLLFGVQQ